MPIFFPCLLVACLGTSKDIGRGRASLSFDGLASGRQFQARPFTGYSSAPGRLRTVAIAVVVTAVVVTAVVVVLVAEYTSSKLGSINFLVRFLVGVIVAAAITVATMIVLERSPTVILVVIVRASSAIVKIVVRSIVVVRGVHLNLSPRQLCLPIVVEFHDNLELCGYKGKTGRARKKTDCKIQTQSRIDSKKIGIVPTVLFMMRAQNIECGKRTPQVAALHRFPSRTSSRVFNSTYPNPRCCRLLSRS